MNNAYRFVLQCPNGHDLSIQRKCDKDLLSDSEAMEMFGDEIVSCPKAHCSWQGKVLKARLLHISPFNWIVSHNAQPKSSDPNNLPKHHQ
jgi:hypothetical protein